MPRPDEGEEFISEKEAFDPVLEGKMPVVRMRQACKGRQTRERDKFRAQGREVERETAVTFKEGSQFQDDKVRCS